MGQYFRQPKIQKLMHLKGTTFINLQDILILKNFGMLLKLSHFFGDVRTPLLKQWGYVALVTKNSSI